MRRAEHPRPDHFLLHLSDTHLLPLGEGLYSGRVRSEQLLARIFDGLEASGARPEAIVFTGDLADHGEPEAYELLRSIVEPAARRLGAQVIWCMGNHDDRGEFKRALLRQLPDSRPVDRVYDVHGLRVITLDTTVPGHHHGEITGAQLDWLAEELSTRAPHGTILAMHHPPVPSVQDLAALVELRRQHELAEVLEGSDVRSILAGHLHYSSMAMFAGIPVSVASATCYSQDLTAPLGATRPQDGGQAYNLVHVFDGTVLHSVVPSESFATLGDVSVAESAAALARAGVVIDPPRNPRIRSSADELDAVDAELEAMTRPIPLP